MGRLRSPVWSALLVVVGIVLGGAAAQFVLPTVNAQVQPGIVTYTPAERQQEFEGIGRDVAQLEQQGLLLKRIAKFVAPTVVHIEAKKDERLGQRFGSRIVEEAGSGVVIKHHDKFYVLTNRHVIKDAENERIDVNLNDRRSVHPMRVWSDAGTDVAVMEIEADALVPARIGNSTGLEIGDFVLAVGSPFGLSHSVTFGIVSAKGRRSLKLGDDGVELQDFIQTDAAINPGNSGGPLINLRGEVVGINTAIASNSGGNEGIGFSIPINMFMVVAKQLVDRGELRRAFLGVKLDAQFDAASAARLGLTRLQGARITKITEGSPAEIAGLRVDDVVLRFNNVWVDDIDHLINLVNLTEVEREVPVVIFREGKVQSLSVTVGDREDFLPKQTALPVRRESDPWETLIREFDAWDIEILGVTVTENNKELMARLKLDANAPGLVVLRVAAAGPAAKEVVPGEIIQQINNQSVRSIDDLEQILTTTDLTHRLRLQVANARDSSSPRAMARIVMLTPEAVDKSITR